MPYQSLFSKQEKVREEIYGNRNEEIKEWKFDEEAMNSNGEEIVKLKKTCWET